MKLSWIIALGAGALIAAACGGTSTLGSGDKPLESGGAGGKGGDGGSSGSGQGGSSGSSGGSAGKAGSGGGGGYEPCAGLPCGATCSICDPNDKECVSDAVIHYCSPNGACAPAYPADCGGPVECRVDSECAVTAGPCELCADGSYACPKAQCLNGKCVAGYEGCSGNKCTMDSDCPAVRAPCQLCADGSVSCPETKCTNGVCVSSFPGCSGYQPCAGKTCGSACSVCDPNDKDCAETAVLKYCDANGMCSPNTPKCSGPGQCTTKADCQIAVDLVCKVCPGGACAEMDCVNGACEFACPPNPTPECKTTLDCPVREVCKPCPNGGCAPTECINGSCQMVCR